MNDSLGADKAASQIKFKTMMLKSSLWNYSDVYIHVIETVTVVGQEADDAAIERDRSNKYIIFK